ncbi:phage protein [Streptococcus parauberis KCTC 11537]|nr:phage protein [Streptococcus parauberis KCTC 11537]QBX17891.1 DNA replication protein [Streptococcus phage Javan383]
MTPFEIEDIQKWIHVDNTPIEVVNMALKEAVVNDKINWKYINKILINWHKAGDNTIEKVQARLEAFELKNSKDLKSRQDQIFLNGQIPTTKRLILAHSR